MPSAQQSIEEKHEAFVRGLASLPLPWRPKNVPAVPDIGADLSTSLPVRHLLGKGFRGDVFYRFRQAPHGDAGSDDYLHVTFDPKKIDYRGFVTEVFVPLAVAFDSYFAEILDEEFLFIDYDERKKRGQHRREGFYRLPTVFYMREDYCQRALALSSSEVFTRLQPHVAWVECTRGGVFVVLTLDILATEEIDQLTRIMGQRLNLK